MTGIIASSLIGQNFSPFWGCDDSRPNLPGRNTAAACRRASDSRAARAGATGSGRTWSSAAYAPVCAVCGGVVCVANRRLAAGLSSRPLLAPRSPEQKDTEFSGQCGKQVEDYMECLHHRKELTRMNVVITQKEKEEAAARNGGDHGHGDGH
ncbi:hypothetical protein PHYPSEUDO_014257 [Phytophthora pseudosyringae]|uniref:Uncharacterized protein n=1 Tax=Phytophthora pseudosyringae TaxID=221518 RepID=A0A8T1WL88_9STRA|nr:hypothetical protein PHYPSEUDO_014257 [Phytophthora pseudosyringae]